MRSRPFITGLGLGLLCALLYLWGLGDLPFHTKGEPREATVVWEIYHSGEWVLPLRNGSIIPSKPPLFHWLGACFSLIRGELNEFTIRLPSALLAIVGVKSVARRRWFSLFCLVLPRWPRDRSGRCCRD